MLYYIKKHMLTHPHSGMTGVIYQICDTTKIRKYVQYNGELDQFKIPISVLYENQKYFNDACYGNLLDSLPNSSSHYNVIEGTRIHYHIDSDNNLCFSI